MGELAELIFTIFICIAICMLIYGFIRWRDSQHWIKLIEKDESNYYKMTWKDMGDNKWNG